MQLVLPLLGEVARVADEAAPQVTAEHQLLDEEPRHDGLAGAWVVGQQEAQPWLGQQVLIHREVLVRKRVDGGGLGREGGREQVTLAQTLCFDDEANDLGVGAEVRCKAVHRGLPRLKRPRRRRGGGGAGLQCLRCGRVSGLHVPPSPLLAGAVAAVLLGDEGQQVDHAR